LKAYLNRREREDYCVISLAVGKTEEMLKSWENNLTADEHKALSMTKTYIYKFMDSIQRRLGPDFVKQLVRDLNSSEIMILPKLQAKREYQKRDGDDGFIEVEKETILNLAEGALCGCAGCTKDYTICDLRNVFMTLEIEPADYEAINKCQYKMEG
jgi:hypothetical protein